MPCGRQTFVRSPLVYVWECVTTQTFTASISQEEDLFVAQCLEIDVASQGKSEDEAIENLKEALALYFEPPRPTVIPKLRKFEVSVGADETTFLSSD